MFRNVIDAKTAPEIAAPFPKPGLSDPSHDVTTAINRADKSGLGRVAGEPCLQVWGDGNKPPSAASSGWLGPVYRYNAMLKIDVAPLKFSKFGRPQSPRKSRSQTWVAELPAHS
jgi:hypothetical protein